MLTEDTIRNYPDLVKAVTGIPADDFWTMMEEIEARYLDYERHRHDREDRQRAVGGGRRCDGSLVLRVTMLLTYLRTHIPQQLVALLYGMTQSDVSRDLRRLLPLISEVLPCPDVWTIVEPTDTTVTTNADADVKAKPEPEPEPEPEPTRPVPQQTVITDIHVLVDATEQEVARSHDRDTRKRYYSGKQKEFTLKTQIVTDADHHIRAISEAVPGTMHDKKLCDALHTLDHVADGSTVEMDKGYQGVASQVDVVTIHNVTTGKDQQVPRLTVRTPHKKPRGSDLTDDQRAANRDINAIRVRVEHCIGWSKNWAILATQFRCSHAIYTSVMQLVCGLVNQQTARWQAAKQREPAYCA